MALPTQPAASWALLIDDDGNVLESFPTASATEGATTDAPLAGETLESATARSGISLWKRVVNKLIEIKALLPTALAAGGGLKVEGVAGGVAQPVSGPLTDVQLRATAVPTSAAQLPAALGTGGGLKVAGVAITTPTHTAVNVTTATGAALAANANRLYALLINDSDTTIYLKLGADAVANQGIRLNSNGGSYELSAMYGNLYTGAINAIHAGTGNKVLTVLEGV